MGDPLHNCWEIMGCGREPEGHSAATEGVCPSATTVACDGLNGGESAGRICWAVAGTFCHGDVQGTFANKLTTCMSCRFYLQVREEQGEAFRHVPEGQPSAADYEQVARAYAQLHQLYGELRVARAELAHGERLREVGQLAAGVAHEINNPLTFVLHSLREVSSGLDELASNGAGELSAALRALHDRSTQALWGANRVRSIVQRLLSLARREDGAPRTPVPIDVPIDAALALASNEIRHCARLQVDLEPGVLVLANETQLAQVFLNLLINAARAIDEGHAERNEIRVRSCTEDGWVHIEVLDTGRGISADQMPRLFEPFFTTRGTSEGTGLGLPVSQRIVESHGGTLEVESRPGHGSRFSVRLPQLVQDAVTTVKAPALSDERRPATGRLVLAVDDERAIGDMIRDLLASQQRVTVATSATEALVHLRTGHFDLILLDLMMPGVSGQELYEWIGAERPELLPNVVFMTGGAFTPQAAGFLPTVQNRVLHKPFGLTELNQVLLEQLGTEPHVLH